MAARGTQVSGWHGNRSLVWPSLSLWYAVSPMSSGNSLGGPKQNTRFKNKETWTLPSSFLDGTDRMQTELTQAERVRKGMTLGTDMAAWGPEEELLRLDGEVPISYERPGTSRRPRTSFEQKIPARERGTRWQRERSTAKDWTGSQDSIHQTQKWGQLESSPNWRLKCVLKSPWAPVSPVKWR